MNLAVFGQSSSDALHWLISLTIPAAAAIVGVALGAWLSMRRERVQRRVAFLEKKLSSFYSPLLGLRSEIRSQSALRLRIQREAEAAWQDVCADTQQLGPADGRVPADRAAEFSRIIDYDNSKLLEDLLPAYHEMLRVFRDNYWLADEDTRRYYEPLVHFVEIWNRWTAGSLPPEVLVRLGHSEENLNTFYTHLQERHDSIRGRLEAGTP